MMGLDTTRVVSGKRNCAIPLKTAAINAVISDKIPGDSPPTQELLHVCNICCLKRQALLLPCLRGTPINSTRTSMVFFLYICAHGCHGLSLYRHTWREMFPSEKLWDNNVNWKMLHNHHVTRWRGENEVKS